MHRTLTRLKESMLILKESEVRKCLDIRECIEVNRKALGSLRSTSQKTPQAQQNAIANVPSRIALPYYSSLSSNSSSSAVSPEWSLFKPASYHETAADDSMKDNIVMGMKLVSIRDKNPIRFSLPSVPATIMLLDAETGVINAILGATYLTAARTAAGSAVATQLCLEASPSPSASSPTHIVLFGAGLQAELHIECLLALYSHSITHISIVNRTKERAEQLSTKIHSQYIVKTSIVELSKNNHAQIQEVVQEADVIITATNSFEPLFHGSWMKPYCHVNGVGSYTSDMREVDIDTVKRSRVIIDTVEARRVGDLKDIANDQSLYKDNIVGLLGDVLANDTEIWNQDLKSGKRSIFKKSTKNKCDCTFFKSVGTAIQDVLTGDLVVKRARELGIGTEFDF